MKKQFTLLLTLLLSAPFLFAQDVDVTISTSNVDPIITAGQYTLLSWSVKSRNNTAAPESKIKFYLSQDDELTRDDLFLGGSVLPKLEEGKEGPVQYLWVQVPSDATAGNYKIFFYVDADNEIAEVSESDNVKAEAVEILPVLQSDLVVESTDLPLIGTEGNQLKIGWAIRNQGKAPAIATYLTVYLSETPEITDASVKVLGVNIDPIYEGERTTDNAIITIPSDSRIDGGVIGKRYLVFDVDSNRQERESNETNNIDFKRIDIKGTADLVSSALSAYGSIDYYAPHTKGVLYNVQFNIENKGNDTSETTSTVKCYLSRDNQLDVNDELIRTITNIPSLDANGGTYEVKFSDRWNGYIPGPGGSSSLENKLQELLNYTIIVVVDSENVISESDETNNTDFKKLEAKGTPDLTSTIVDTYGSIDYYAPHAKDVLYNVQLKIENQGTTNSDTISIAKCYLSVDNTLDANDEFIRTINIPALDANGGSYEIDFSDRWNKQIPGGPDGSISLEDKLYELLNYSVIVVVDAEDTITESNENNNIASKNITIEPLQSKFKSSEKTETTLVFPVPTKDVLNVTVANHTVITLHNTFNGSAILTKEFAKSGTYQLNVAHLKMGTYILKDNKGKNINIVKE